MTVAVQKTPIGGCEYAGPRNATPKSTKGTPMECPSMTEPSATNCARVEDLVLVSHVLSLPLGEALRCAHRDLKLVKYLARL